MLTLYKLPVVVFLLGMLAEQTKATDYYFRPAVFSLSQQWVSDLSFTLTNPSDSIVLLDVSLVEEGVIPARQRDKSDVIWFLPAQLVLHPRQTTEIKLANRVIFAGDSTRHFKLNVKQQPVLYVRPGDQGYDAEHMMLRHYEADISIRPVMPNAEMMASVTSYKTYTTTVKK